MKKFACLIAMAVAPVALMAQSVTMYGSLTNFDVINNSGETTYGFEIEVEGVTNIGGTFTANRYGAPQITPTPNGVGFYVRYMAQWDPVAQKFRTGTPVAVKPTVTTGHQCVQGTVGYDTSGCEHFGVWTYVNPVRTVYRWLIADPNNPGQLMPYGSAVAIPAPVWSVQPPAVVGAAPDVVVEVPAPIPPAVKMYGEAQWMKTYKTENQRQVGLDELVADNAVVPEDEAHLEVSWELLQDSVGDGGGKRKRHRGSLGGGSHAVVRRFELYKFTGTYDPVTNQAICADLTCSAPAATEVGDFIGAQNAAANLNVPAQYPVNVTIAGDGFVSAADRTIDCPGTCSSWVSPDAVVTLTAKSGKGQFSGWTGACAGNQLTCTMTVNSPADVKATFLMSYKLVTKTNGKGSISGAQSGSSFPQGTSVTLTATPASGSSWVGWSGACSGTATKCTVVINADTTVQANFR